MSEDNNPQPIPPTLQEILDHGDPIAIDVNGLINFSALPDTSFGILYQLPEQAQACLSLHDRMVASYNFCRGTQVASLNDGSLRIGDSSVVNAQTVAATQRDALLVAMTSIHGAAASLDTSMATIQTMAAAALNALHA